MPIYEYVCEKCGSHLEVMQKHSDPPPKRCRKCRGKLEKIISRTAFQLKGSGWYKTDYSAKSTSDSADNGDKTDKTDKSVKKTEKAEKKAESSDSSKSD
jgi:putative FmdB family regulatory protein